MRNPGASGRRTGAGREAEERDEVGEAYQEGGRGGSGRGTRRASVGASRRRARGRTREPDPGRDLGPEADPESLARTIVLTKLTAQARTRQELTTALQRRNVPDEVAEQVLDRMEDVGLVDDAAFAEAWVSSRQSRRHLSKTALRRELVRKGVDREHVDTAVAQVSGGDEYAAASSLAQKKAAGMRALDPVVRRRRLAGVLARKGFGADVTRQVLAEVLAGLAEQDAAVGDDVDVAIHPDEDMAFDLDEDVPEKSG